MSDNYEINYSYANFSLTENYKLSYSRNLDLEDDTIYNPKISSNSILQLRELVTNIEYVFYNLATALQ